MEVSQWIWDVCKDQATVTFRYRLEFYLAYSQQGGVPGPPRSAQKNRTLKEVGGVFAGTTSSLTMEIMMAVTNVLTRLHTSMHFEVLILKIWSPNLKNKAC